jgi:two-component system, OmpR family, sensor kinase
MTRLSLRVRLLMLTVGFLAIGLSAGGGIAITALHGHLVGQIDDRLRPVAEVFARVPPGQLNGTGRPNAVAAGMDLLGSPYLAVLGPDGALEREIAPARQFDQPKPLLPDVAATGVPVDVPAQEGGGQWRLIKLPRESSGSVVAAASLSSVDATVERLRTVCLLTGAALLLVLAAAGWFAVRAGLRPLDRIEQTAAAIAGGDLSHRVPRKAGPRTEIGRLTAALNGMLVQIETASAARAASEAKMRRFVADVSHELRTPLAGIKGFADLYEMGALPEKADIDRTMRRIRAESGRLAQLTDDLLLLAQFDDQPSLQLGPTDLRTLAADARHDLRALDPARAITLTGPCGQPIIAAEILGDEARLRQVVSNLVGNVIAHTPTGTAVRIGVGTLDGTAILEIEDAGPGLTPEQAGKVFDRFYRAEDSRARTGHGGAGLGLSIAWSIVAAHGGRIELSSAECGGATFRVLFPALSY